MLEWSAPEDGLADVSFAFVGRNHAETDNQWHLAKWVFDDVEAKMKWTDLGFVLVTQAQDPGSPASLSASGVSLKAGESLFLYGYVWDHDAYDGTLIRGGITFTPASQDVIPEPASLSLVLLGLLSLAGRQRLRRRAGI